MFNFVTKLLGIVLEKASNIKTQLLFDFGTFWNTFSLFSAFPGLLSPYLSPFQASCLVCKDNDHLSIDSKLWVFNVNHKATNSNKKINFKHVFRSVLSNGFYLGRLGQKLVTYNGLNEHSITWKKYLWKGKN